MDMWTDPNLFPYMAVTAHWLQLVTEKSGNDSRLQLKLRADLIGFHRVPSRHTGEHLSVAFLYILDRIKITHKVSTFICATCLIITENNQIGWITMDNASNNDTCMEALAKELTRRQITFDKLQ